MCDIVLVCRAFRHSLSWVYPHLCFTIRPPILSQNWTLGDSHFDEKKIGVGVAIAIGIEKEHQAFDPDSDPDSDPEQGSPRQMKLTKSDARRFPF